MKTDRTKEYLKEQYPDEILECENDFKVQSWNANEMIEFATDFHNSEMERNVWKLVKMPYFFWIFPKLRKEYAKQEHTRIINKLKDNG